MAQERRNEITNAIRKLGEMSHNINIKDGGSTAFVKVDGEYFGIWSFITHAFVD